MDLNKYSVIRIVVVGLGGTGSYLVSFLTHLLGNSKVLLDKVSIAIVDEDVVELKNLRNQKFLLEDVGRCKSEVLYDRYSSIYPKLELSYADEYVTNCEQLEGYFRTPDGEGQPRDVLCILVSCVDNMKARRVFDDLFRKEGHLRDLLYIDTGNGIGEKLTGQTVVGFRTSKFRQTEHPIYGFNSFFGVQDPVIEMPPPSEYFPQILTDEDEPEAITCGSADVPVQNLGANIMSATNTFNILNNVLCFGELPGQFFLFDAKTNSIKGVG